jgi:hypothetical protein
MKDPPFPVSIFSHAAQRAHILIKQQLSSNLLERINILIPYQPGTDRRPETEHASEIVQPPC